MSSATPKFDAFLDRFASFGTVRRDAIMARRLDEVSAAIEIVVDRKSILVRNTVSELVSVPLADLLGEMSEEQVWELQSAFRAVLAFYAGKGRGLEIGAFRRFCSEPLHQIIRQLENIVSDRLANIGQAGVDLVSNEAVEDFPDADLVILRRLLRQPDNDARQNRQRAFKVKGSLLHSIAPSWLLSLFSGRRG